MPYIKKATRAQLNYVMNEIVEQLKFAAPILLDRPGPTNYVISRIVLRAMKPDSGWSYHSISRAVAVLRDAATEMERRLMASREDDAIEENGDLPEYKNWRTK